MSHSHTYKKKGIKGKGSKCGNASSNTRDQEPHWKTKTKQKIPQRKLKVKQEEKRNKAINHCGTKTKHVQNKGKESGKRKTATASQESLKLKATHNAKSLGAPNRGRRGGGGEEGGGGGGEREKDYERKDENKDEERRKS